MLCNDNALESLNVADFLNKEDFSPLWVIVSSYYYQYSSGIEGG
jgi:hypothetical protein